MRPHRESTVGGGRAVGADPRESAPCEGRLRGLRAEGITGGKDEFAGAYARG